MPQPTFDRLMRFREGAHYSRMDLHTHSPASECSSYRLPDVLEDHVPDAGNSMSKAHATKVQAFLQGLADGALDALRTLHDAEVATAFAWIEPPHRPQLMDDALTRAASAWLDDIPSLPEGDRRALNALLKDAIRDVRAVLRRPWFTLEYVTRCTIEELRIVALTDHNHPGYVVPRLGHLGTWFGGLVDCNRLFEDDIADNEGARVRGWVIARLKQAKAVVQGSTDALTSHGDPATKKQHKARAKALAVLTDRLEAIQERLTHWEAEGTHPERLYLLPGTEVTVSNVHILTVYPPTWYVPGRIASILRRSGIPEQSWGRGFDAASDVSVQTTIDLVHEAGGIAIPAHANSSFKGILRLFEKGLALTKVLNHPALLAVETVGGSVVKGKDAAESLRWLDKQAQGEQRSRMLAFTKGSDAHEVRIEIDGIGEDIGERFTWVKLDLRPRDTPDEVFRAVRFALIAGQSRIIEHPTEDSYNYAAAKLSKGWRITKEERTPLLDWRSHHPAILGFSVSGGPSYAQGLELRLNPFLNCVVGQDGKATVLRLIGWALGAVSFLAESDKAWLPEEVRLYLHATDGTIRCVERIGRSADPHGPTVKARVLELRDGAFVTLTEDPTEVAALLNDAVDVWPSPEVLAGRNDLADKSKSQVASLIEKLDVGADKRPLLVLQPYEIFDRASLFEQVLRRPNTKFRQVIWATGSANVPTALDADKIVVVEEVVKRKKARLHVVAGGDLHEDEIVEKFLDRMEGGRLGFARRQALYGL